MKYFTTEYLSSNYNEFQKGNWDGNTFHKEDSVYLDDNILYDARSLLDAIIEVFPELRKEEIEPVISREEWVRIGKLIPPEDYFSTDVYNDLRQWAQDVFEEYRCLTIIWI